MARFDHCSHGTSHRAPCAACIEAERRFEAETLLDAEADWLSDPDDHPTQVFPDGFSGPCERCGGPSMGDRYCVECECLGEGMLCLQPKSASGRRSGKQAVMLAGSGRPAKPTGGTVGFITAKKGLWSALIDSRGSCKALLFLPD